MEKRRFIHGIWVSKVNENGSEGDIVEFSSGSVVKVEPCPWKTGYSIVNDKYIGSTAHIQHLSGLVPIDTPLSGEPFNPFPRSQ